MLKVGIVGCGKIADSHALQIRRIKGCEIVSGCDREPLMARQFCERFKVAGQYSDVAEMLHGETKPDVVHITTPPQSHFDIATQCLEAGCHVYVEKPFTLRMAEAEILVALATEKRRKLTVGHDEQFSHVARRMRTLVQRGFLGSAPVHMESTWCYNLSEPKYAKAFLGDEHHWVRELPGGLLHNVISHGVAKIAEFLVGQSPAVFATGFVSQFLKACGEQHIVDELRVTIVDQQGTTAYFSFSSQMRPSLHQFRILGSENGLLIDLDTEMLLELRGKRYKSYLEKFVPPLMLAREACKNTLRNVRLFCANDFHMDAGKKCLIEGFYRSIIEDAPVPIPYREILLTTRIMEEIFSQLNGASGGRGTCALRRAVPMVGICDNTAPTG